MDYSSRKYFALAILILLGAGIIYMMKSYLAAIFAAVVLTILTYPIYKKLLEKWGKPVLAASSVIAMTLLLIFIPLSTLLGLTLQQVATVDIQEEKILQYEQSIEKLTGRDINIVEEFSIVESFFRQQIKEWVPALLSITSSLLIFLVIMFFVQFYLLLQKDFFYNQALKLLPFSRVHSRYFLQQSSDAIKAVLIGQVLTAVIQGGLGMISFLIVGVEGAIFWGFVMMILSLIPVVGAFLVWLPAGLFLLLEGSIWQGIFVLAWGAIIVSNIDNFIRPKLVNRFADIHPLETFLGIFIGIAYFDLIGIVLGPLILLQFKVLLRVYRKEYAHEEIKE